MKKVINEITKLDLSEEFTPYQKQILKYLNLKLKDQLFIGDFEMWEECVTLIEDFHIDYEESYMLVDTYKKFRHILFNEIIIDKFKIQTNRNEIFKSDFRNTIKNYIGKNPETISNIDITFNNKTLNTDVLLWDMFGSFILYLPLNYIENENIILKVNIETLNTNSLNIIGEIKIGTNGEIYSTFIETINLPPVLSRQNNEMVLEDIISICINELRNINFQTN